MAQASLSAGRAHNCLYEPRSLYARKAMLQRFSFANLSRDSYHSWGVSDTIKTEFVGQQPLEELVEDQALSADLKQVVMACLCGRESRRWTIGELVERLGALGLSCSRASVCRTFPRPWRR